MRMAFLGNSGSKQTEQGRRDVLEVKLTLALVTGWEEFCSRHRVVGAKKQMRKHHVCVRNWTGPQRSVGEEGREGHSPGKGERK